MSRSPAVSIVIPAFNAARWIGATLDSALAQTLADHEIIVVDDGSTDNTREIVESYRQRDPRIHLIQIANSGVGAARNAGIAAAKGEFIAPLDADDLWAPEKLEKQVRRLHEAGEETAMAYCGSRLIDENDEPLMNYPRSEVEGNIRSPLIMWNFIGNASIPVFRASALRHIGPYLTREEQGGAQGCEDWDLTLRIAEKWRVAAVPDILADYRITRGCMTSGTGSMLRSYRIMLAGARRRNPDLPEALFRWSAAYFIHYLAGRCYQDSNYRGCLENILQAVRHDPLMLLDSRTHMLTFKCLVFESTGLRKAPRPHVRIHQDGSKPVKKILIQRIRARRWRNVCQGLI